VPTSPDAGRFVIVAALLLAAKLLLQTWFLAPYSPDVLSYHLPKLGEWMRAGAFVRELGSDSHASFPAGFELIEAWWVVFLRHDVLIELAGVEFLLLAAAATYALARHVGVSPRGACFAALLYAMIPAFQVMTTSCLNDVPVAAVVVTAAALIAQRARPEWILAALGLALGIKPTAGYALPGLLLFWVLRRRAEPQAVVFSRAGAALALLGLGLGGMWYARNAVCFGNPFHPIGCQDFYDPSGNRHIQSGASLASFVSNAGSLINDRLYDRAPFVASLFRNPTMRPLAASLGLSAATVLVLVIHDDWNLRFVLFLPSLLAVAVADVAERAPQVRAVAAFGLLLQFATTLAPGDLSRDEVRSLASQGWRERAIGGGVYPPALPEGPVGFLDDTPGPAYLLYGPDFCRRVVYLRTRTSDSLWEEIRNAGVQSVYLVPSSEGITRFLEWASRAGRLRPLGGPFFAVVGP
jgi:hypothetical protein